MDVYSFFNLNTTGFLTNFLSDVLGGPVKFIAEYEEDSHVSRVTLWPIRHPYQKQEGKIKSFIFGLNGLTFEFLITIDNRIGFYFHNDNLKPEHSILFGTSLNNTNVELVRLNLISLLREYKINQII